MATNYKSTDFLRFSAYSIKDLITRKLSEDSKFTDQIYEGSNLAIIIDLIAYMYQCLVYQLNNAAAESMFADTQIFENISRLVSSIGYHPRGCKPSSIIINAIRSKTNSNDRIIILPFTKFKTGMTDSNGKEICFSTNDEEQSITGSLINEITLYNGEWKLYSTIFTASGIDFETFDLNLFSDTATNTFVANSFFAVYVYSKNPKTEKTTFSKWTFDNEELLMTHYADNDDNPSFAKIYNVDDKKYSIKLTEDKHYQLKFGDGRICKKLTKGDKIFIFYLDTNGIDGNVDIGKIDVDQLKVVHSPTDFNLSKQMYAQLFNINSEKLDDKKYFQNAVQKTENSSPDITLQLNIDSLIKYSSEETVDDIKNNAPGWFRFGNRLITKNDYEYFIRNDKHFSDVIDVKCMNNWEYVTSFYKWLYYYGINPAFERIEELNTVLKRKSNKREYYYLDNYRIVSNGYMYVDAADAANIYLWLELINPNLIASKNASIDQLMGTLKTLTSEIYAIAPIHVRFDICACDYLTQYNYMIGKTTSNNSYIEITLDDNSIYVAADIQSRVASVILSYFNKLNCKIGQLIKYDDILNDIYAITGVSRVRTIFEPDEDQKKEGLKTIIKNGLSFASYSTSILDLGEDLEISNISKKLEDFQFPEFSTVLNNSTEFDSHIKIIKKSLPNTSPIKV